MRFDEPSRNEDEPLSPSSVVPQSNRTSRAIRIKLTMLFAMLIMVVFLMKEAGKPERWEWMGLDNAPIQNQTNSVANQAGRNSTTNLNETSEPVSNNESGKGSANPKLQTPLKPAPPSNNKYPVAAVKFWTSTLRKLSDEQQTIFLRLLKHVRSGTPVPETESEAAEKLVRIVANQREQFHQTLFDQLAVAADGSREKNRLSEEMFQSQEVWESKIGPALASVAGGEECTIGQLKSAEQLQLAIDPILFQQVKDKTSIGWTGDSATWKRLWEKAITEELPEARPTTRIELMGQPKSYRGQAIEIEGWVRSARRKTLGTDSELGLSHYYILWLRPRESKLGTYCVYTESLPADFPPVGDTFSDFNENVKVRGYFFKIRNYIAADSQVTDCPLLIAPAIEPIKVVQFTAVNQWQPSRGTLVSAFLFIPLFAIGIAWLAFRTSKSNHYVPGKKTKAKIDDSLEALSKDPEIKTDRERVLELYESEPANE